MTQTTEMCLSCGEMYGDEGNPLMKSFTKINKEGPYCVFCIESADEQEWHDNSQFGVGA